MPELLASSPIIAPSGPAPAAPLRAAPVALPGAVPAPADFGVALNGLLLPGAAPRTRSDRQSAAEGGKALPDDPESADPLIAWLPEGLVAIAPPAMIPSSDELALPTMAAPSPAPGQLPPVAPGESGSALAPGSQPAALPIAGGLSAEPATPGKAIVIEAAGDPSPQPEQLPEVVDAGDVMAPRDRFDTLSTRATAPTMVALKPAPESLTTGAAAQVFAAARAVPLNDPAVSDRVADTAILLGGHARTEQLNTVQAASGASQAPLDLTRDDWTGAMIDRIAALRESAEAADTRIKLAPENLGALEISIRRDGDRIHVHFTAENAAARQMIADAAPRLAELADARGVKLGQTSVEGGNAGGGQHGSTREQQPQSPASAHRSVAGESDATTDERIA